MMCALSISIGSVFGRFEEDFAACVESFKFSQPSRFNPSVCSALRQREALRQVCPTYILGQIRDFIQPIKSGLLSSEESCIINFAHSNSSYLSTIQIILFEIRCLKLPSPMRRSLGRFEGRFRRRRRNLPVPPTFKVSPSVLLLMALRRVLPQLRARTKIETLFTL